MGKVIVITGASSGIGKATAKYFSQKGWTVAATMRNPKKEKILSEYRNIKLYNLDVTDKHSIDKALNQIINDFDKIDVIVNNAGYAVVGVFEEMTLDSIHSELNTNVVGVMRVTKAILPHFRENKSGQIVNIASIGGRITFPLYSVYHASKWAVEGFSESLKYELSQFGIKIKIIEPGAINTDFYKRSQDLVKPKKLTQYSEYTERVFKNLQKTGDNAPLPIVVAKTIYKAVNDKSNKLRYVCGSEAPFIMFLRKILPDQLFGFIVKKVLKG